MSSTGTLERLRDAIALLEVDRRRIERCWKVCPPRIGSACCRRLRVVYSPDRAERRRMAKAAARDRKAERVKQDEDARAETGIRTLRQKPIFHTPNVFPPENFEQQDVDDEDAQCAAEAGFSRPTPKSSSTATSASRSTRRSITSTTRCARRAPS